MLFVSPIRLTFKFTKPFSRFNGVSFKAEPSSQFSHRVVTRLGVYRKSPFVTGSYDAPNGLTTEILDYEIGEWIQYDDYPFSNSDR